jgi:hypothetical protein
MNEHMKKLTIHAIIAGGLAAAPALYRLKFELPQPRRRRQCSSQRRAPAECGAGEDILG